ncbi:MAG: hypothetical protein WC979_04775 [Candidatus Pacearchaeota archaeon]|jgi:hypothetical protein
MKVKTYQNHESRYRDVMNIITDGNLWTLREIQKELRKKDPSIIISIQGIKKHLKTMIRSHFCLNLRFNKNSKNQYQKVFDQKFPKKLDRYYITTFRSGVLADFLARKVTGFPDKKKYVKMIEKVVIPYKSIEFQSIMTRHIFKNDRIIDGIIKDERKKGKIITKGSIEKDLEKAFKLTTKLKKIKFNPSLKIIKIKGKKYFEVNGDLISMSRLMDFMKILNSDLIGLDVYEKWFAYNVSNKENLMIPVHNAMRDLFIEMVKDSQKKI